MAIILGSTYYEKKRSHLNFRNGEIFFSQYKKLHVSIVRSFQRCLYVRKMSMIFVLC